jgi:hypothetical protein
VIWNQTEDEIIEGYLNDDGPARCRPKRSPRYGVGNSAMDIPYNEPKPGDFATVTRVAPALPDRSGNEN